MLAVGAPFVSHEQLKMMWGGVASDHAGAGAGAAAPCEPWQAVALVEAGTCGALGLRRIDRGRMSTVLKEAGRPCMELVRAILATHGGCSVVEVALETSTDYGSRYQ